MRLNMHNILVEKKDESERIKRELFVHSGSEMVNMDGAIKLPSTGELRMAGSSLPPSLG